MMLELLVKLPYASIVITVYLVFCVADTNATYWTQGNDVKLSVNLQDVNDYFVTINDETWLYGGEPNIWCDNLWHSPSDNTLTPQLSIPNILNGTNKELGFYSLLEMIYTINSTNKSSLCFGKTFITQFIYYYSDDVFEFKQYFPNGLSSTNIKQYLHSPAYSIPVAMIPITEFPVWSYNDKDLLKSSLGYIEWQGRHLNDRTNYGIGLQLFEGGNEGGPVLFFQNGIKRSSSLIISTSSQFMNGIFAIRTRRNYNNYYVLLNNTNLNNDNDIQIIKNIKNENECANLCLNTYKWCNTFQYSINNKQCHLKYNNRGESKHNDVISGMLSNKTYFVAGIEGNITFLPDNYEISFIISGTKNQGIHGCMEKFGNVLKTKYSTKKLFKDTNDDMVTNYLGYWTDNGGYYYGSNPLSTSIATELFDSFRVNNIPIRYLQLDPFWYCGGHIGDKVDNNLVWIADSKLFPDNGLFDLHKSIGSLPLLLYSAFWSPTTADYYNKHFNLNINFTDSISFDNPGVENPISLPLTYNDSYTFYKYIISQYSNITIGFEIDWMDYEYGEFSAFTNNINGSIQWTRGMNDANIFNNQSMQYCMSLSNYALTSLMYPSVTNIRCSEDNFPTNTNRWKIAYSSLFIASMDLLPYFDVVWTTSIQSGNKYGVNSMDVELQSIISILTCGPYGIGDNINQTNKTIINRVSRLNDGLLLHPSYPITPIDLMLFNNTNTISTKNNGEIWFTFTTNNTNTSMITSYIVLSIDYSYNLTFDDLYPYPNDNDNYIVYKFNDSNININDVNINTLNNNLKLFNKSKYLNILTNRKPINNPTHLHSWNLYNILRIQPNGWILMGDLTCYVSVSPQRFQNLKIISNGLSVVVKGSPNEIITVTFRTNKNIIIHKQVNFNQNGDDQTVIVQS